ncbi:hypothetical protein IKB17_00175 [bacterium]|nr:hypothetical protein [bacterium]
MEISAINNARYNITTKSQHDGFPPLDSNITTNYSIKNDATNAIELADHAQKETKGGIGIGLTMLGVLGAVGIGIAISKNRSVKKITKALEESTAKLEETTKKLEETEKKLSSTEKKLEDAEEKIKKVVQKGRDARKARRAEREALNSSDSEKGWFRRMKDKISGEKD